jgi:hypothetical protein
VVAWCECEHGANWGEQIIYGSKVHRRGDVASLDRTSTFKSRMKALKNTCASPEGDRPHARPT